MALQRRRLAAVLLVRGVASGKKGDGEKKWEKEFHGYVWSLTQKR